VPADGDRRASGAARHGHFQKRLWGLMIKRRAIAEPTRFLTERMRG
jgi:hypothetical protein